MAQIAVTGLAEVLNDHEDRIAAAQAWCVQQNIRSIDELKSRGDAAEDAFVVAAFSSHRVGPVDAAGRVSFTGNFLDERKIKQRIREYRPPPPPAAPTRSPPLWATAEPKPAPYEDNARSLLGDDHAARCLRLRQTLPRLEMPCVRAATATIGVLLDRARVPMEIRRTTPMGSERSPSR